MSDSKNKLGNFVWVDLTVEDASTVRDFYQKVIGWEPSPVSMGDYDDYCMAPKGSEAVAGICHAKGPNASIPPAWLVYVVVDDVNRSVEECRGLGGEVLVGPMAYGGQGHYCIIKDPAGAVLALYSDNK